MSRLSVTYRKSAIGYHRDQKATVAALGLKKLNHSVEHEDTPSILGMIQKVRHLVSVNGQAADTPAGMAVLDGLAEKTS
ncbi:MAG: 50S ribosomal protein L30 [Candidatus Dormibacteria bacterium]